MKQFTTLLSLLMKSFFRDQQSLSFTLAFPVVFLVIFGFLYAPTGGEPFRPLFALYMEEEEGEGAASLKKVLEAYQHLIQLEEVGSLQELQEGIGKNQFHFGLVFTSSRLDFYYNPTRIQSNHYYQQLAEGITGDFNEAQTGLLQLIQVQRHALATREGISQLDYLLPGIIALGILSIGMFSITGSFMHLREKGVLKRLAATPLKKTFFLGSLMVTRLLVAFLSSLLLIGVGRVIFGLEPQIHWLLFLPFLLTSTLAMMALGFLITLWARSAQNASEIASILLTIMIFFSGIYIPVDILPQYLQRVGQAMPLYYLAKGFRGVMNVQPLPFPDLFLMMLIMLGGTVLILLLASWKIPWEERG